MKIFKKLDFSPTNINLYYQAFTHTSFSNENPSFVSYERLEFLGDAILEFIISEYLYKERHLEEGVMTKSQTGLITAAFWFALLLQRVQTRYPRGVDFAISQNLLE